MQLFVAKKVKRKYVTSAGIQNSTLILEDRLYVCESGDEIRSLNDRCNQRKDCNDDSDERDCAQCKFQCHFEVMKPNESNYMRQVKRQRKENRHVGGAKS